MWEELLPTLKLSWVLEIGCFEGKSTCYLIETLASCRDIELQCVDTWGGDRT
ncbi:MAG: hypothetical protein J6P47_00605 [Acetobacter sp.]|nr:hypothetical protein [Acetobacter sp.]